MPSTIIRTSSAPDSRPSTKGTNTFTGEVWVDPIHNACGIKINNVFFSAGARSDWHTHEYGQLLRVTAGSGWICDKGGVPRRIQMGDMVWAGPGTTHWHGGDDGSFLCHTAVSHGATTWHGPVDAEEYMRKGKDIA